MSSISVTIYPAETFPIPDSLEVRFLGSCHSIFDCYHNMGMGIFYYQKVFALFKSCFQGVHKLLNDTVIVYNVIRFSLIFLLFLFFFPFLFFPFLFVIVLCFLSIYFCSSVHIYFVRPCICSLFIVLLLFCHSLFASFNTLQFATSIVGGGHIQYYASHFPKCRTLNWLREEICKYVLRRAICYLYFTFLYFVGYKKISYVEVSSSFRA